MDWSNVGEWLKSNAGTGASLVGSLLTGNVPGAVAAGVALVSSATGSTDPAKALEALQTDPATMVRLRELAIQDEESIREHIRGMAEMYLTDIQDARKRDGVMVQAGVVNHRANAMAGAACILVLTCLAVTVWYSGMDDFAKGTITLVCGRALGWVEQIFSFEFGTTRANKTKDDTINNLTK